HDGARSIPHRGPECLIDFIGSRHHYGWCNFDASNSARELHLFEKGFRKWVSSVPKSSDAAHVWQHVAHELDTLAEQLSSHQGYSGNVSTGMTKARYQAGSKRIARHNDDRNFTRRLLRGERTGCVHRHND